MPEPIDVEKTRARLEKGMLHITAAKALAAKVTPINRSGCVIGSVGSAQELAGHTAPAQHSS